MYERDQRERAHKERKKREIKRKRHREGRQRERRDRQTDRQAESSERRREREKWDLNFGSPTWGSNLTSLWMKPGSAQGLLCDKTRAQG